MNTNTEVTTRSEAGAEGTKTNLTINWDGMSQDDLIALAQIQLVVKLQAAWRKDGIPAGDLSVNAVDYKVGVRAPRTKQTLEQMLASLSAEQRAELLAKFSA